MQSQKSKNRIVGAAALILTLLVMGVIFFFSSQPGTESDRVSISFTSFIFNASAGEVLNCIVRKFAHLLEYMALGAPLYLFLRSTGRGELFSCSLSSVISVLYAVSDEIHQLFVQGRACLISDMVLDSLGAILSIFLLHILLKSPKKNSDAKPDETGKKFLDICSCFATGKALGFDSVSDEEIREIFLLAEKQKLLPAVYSVMSERGMISAENEMKKRALGQISAQIQRSNAFCAVYGKMLLAGANPLCIKGFVCRSYYGEPDLRPSSDEDLIVNAKDLEICSDILCENGFFLLSEDDGERIFASRETGCRIELHRTPFGNGNAFSGRLTEAAGDLFSSASYENILGFRLLCPDADTHLIYLIFHAFNHFINAGVGIRQIMDISVFAKNNKIDYGEIFSRCCKAGVDKFAEAVFLISAEYFGFDLDLIKSAVSDFDESVDIIPMLNDIVSGGIYGGGLDRRHASSVTSNEKMSLLKAVFPPSSQLKKRFPVLKKHKWLLPAVWVKRILIFVLDEGSSNAVSEAKRRAGLVAYYTKNQFTV